MWGYCRASTKKQVDSPETQKEKIRDYVHFHKLGDATFFVDPAKSGKVSWEDRSAGAAMFKHLRPGDRMTTIVKHDYDDIPVISRYAINDAIEDGTVIPWASPRR